MKSEPISFRMKMYEQEIIRDIAKRREVTVTDLILEAIREHYQLPDREKDEEWYGHA